MPGLEDDLHLKMLARGREKHREHELYGLQWGDPDTKPTLRFFAEHYIRPYLDPHVDAVEIGPGGGRWTQMLVAFRRLYAVDYHQELLDELDTAIRTPRLVPVCNDGLTLPGIGEGSIAYVLSYGVFVHLDEHIRLSYLKEIHRVLAPGGRAVIQYGDKRKRHAAGNPTFAENTAPAMRQAVLDHGFFIIEENLTLLPHSNVIVIRRGDPAIEQTPPGA